MKKKCISGLIDLFILVMFLLTKNTHADEIGVAVGINTSTYKPWYENSAKYQKINILNPIEITFQKNLIKFLGIHSSLQYSKKSISELIEVADITGIIGSVKYEKELNYLSLEISPILSFRFNRIQIDGRLGVSGDFYINEWTNNFGWSAIASRSKETSPFILSFVSGIGLGYIIKNRFKIGLRSSISRTLTDIYKNQAEDVAIYYLNFHNVLCFGFLF